MNGRIIIPAQDKRGAHRDPNEFMQVPRGEWLALVKAVEAAQYACDRWPAQYADAEPQRVLKRALSRFDFEEQE